MVTGSQLRKSKAGRGEFLKQKLRKRAKKSRVHPGDSRTNTHHRPLCLCIFPSHRTISKLTQASQEIPKVTREDQAAQRRVLSDLHQAGACGVKLAHAAGKGAVGQNILHLGTEGGPAHEGQPNARQEERAQPQGDDKLQSRPHGLLLSDAEGVRAQRRGSLSCLRVGLSGAVRGGQEDHAPFQAQQQKQSVACEAPRGIISSTARQPLCLLRDLGSQPLQLTPMRILPQPLLQTGHTGA